MPRKVKTKYTLRSDGRIVATKKYGDTRKSFYGHSDAEVEEKIRAYEAALNKVSEHPFSALADDWWAAKQNEISPGSYNCYRVAYARAVDFFGDTAVSEITPARVYEYLIRYANQGYSQKVINNSRGVLKGILDLALIRNWIPSNPCVALPLVKGKPKVKRKPASEQAQQLVSEIRSDSHISALYFTALKTGLRRGELVALEWDNVDFEKGLIHVVQNCAWLHNKPIIKSTKTEAGTRTVVMVSQVSELLQALPRLGKYVFFAELPTQGEIQAAFRRFKKQYGITATPHQFRHSYATNAHEAGLDGKDIQSQLGHTTLAMTMDVYTDSDKSQLARVRASLDPFCQQSCQTAKKP